MAQSKWLGHGFESRLREFGGKDENKSMAQIFNTTD